MALYCQSWWNSMLSKCPLSATTTCPNKSTKISGHILQSLYRNSFTFIDNLHQVGNHVRMFSVHYTLEMPAQKEIAWTEIWRIQWPVHTLARFECGPFLTLNLLWKDPLVAVVLLKHILCSKIINILCSMYTIFMLF